MTKLNCGSGNYQCGGVCQSTNRKCTKKAEGQAAESANQLKQLIEKKGTTGKAPGAGSSPTPEDNLAQPKNAKEAGKELKKVAKKGQASALGGKANELALVQEFRKIGGQEPDPDVAKEFDETRKQLGADVGDERARQAADMAEKSMAWARQNGFEAEIDEVVWTARPGSMKSAGITGTDGAEIQQARHPADVVVKFKDGQSLGISAKSTLGKDDITFKNRGAGTLGQQLGTNSFKSIADDASRKFAQDNGLGDLSGSKLKKAIREKPELVAAANEQRPKVLNSVRDSLASTLNDIPADQRADRMRELFLDTDDQGLRYIKATGTSGESRISDPTDNKVLRNLENVQFAPKGNDTIQVFGKGGEPLFTIRAKYESQALASGIKFDVK